MLLADAIFTAIGRHDGSRWPLDYLASANNLASARRLRESAFTPNRLTNRARGRNGLHRCARLTRSTRFVRVYAA
ncbi:hypothetical protein PSAB6_200015 [Paraburkholderia sabiae]|nr:hypothetical protein PSAB6_200015 [Paraburkholderia sabiae]